MRLIILAFALCASACANYRDPALDAYPTKGRQDMDREATEDSVRRMQDEFNRLHPDA